MKLKLDQTRTYDKDGFRRRAACLCLRSEEKPEILLVTSSRFSHLWIVPGGGVDPGEGPVTAALREIEEEAGVNGKMLGLLDIFENTVRKTRTYVYVVLVESLRDDYEDALKIGRERKWFTLEDACTKLQAHKPIQTSYVRTFIKQQIGGLRLIPVPNPLGQINGTVLAKTNCDCNATELIKCEHNYVSLNRNSIDNISVQ